MSEPLTTEHFEKFEKHFDETMGTIADVLTDHTEKLTVITATINDHTKHFERIEHIMWDGQRLDEHERRIIELAETVGRPDLATPSLGS